VHPKHEGLVPGYWLDNLEPGLRKPEYHVFDLDSRQHDYELHDHGRPGDVHSYCGLSSGGIKLHDAYHQQRNGPWRRRIRDSVFLQLGLGKTESALGDSVSHWSSAPDDRANQQT
jgi:hypothetical protein